MARKLNVKKIGRAFRSYATHHDHGDGWTYTRDLKGMKHIRYASDFTGRNTLWNRTRNTVSGLAGLGKRSIFRPTGLRDWFWSILATIRVRMLLDDHMPDGALNGGIVITHWEEDGEYIEWVGPTVGEKIADFLEAEPENPHAVLIATEMMRVRQLGIDRRKEPETDGTN